LFTNSPAEVMINVNGPNSDNRTAARTQRDLALPTVYEAEDLGTITI